jgi:hypothetical protein
MDTENQEKQPEGENNPKKDIDQEFINSLLYRVVEQKNEERDRALTEYDKYVKKAHGVEEMMLIGRSLTSFLSVASSASNTLADLAKELYKTNAKDNDIDKTANSVLDMSRDEIAKAVKDSIQSRREQKKKEDNGETLGE